VSHEPEVAATVYLAGFLNAAERERFEGHLLACEECWREVQAAHRGRALAESLREVAPQPLRERVRASVAAASRSDRHRRRPLAAVVVVTILAVVAVGVLVGQRRTGQPAEITAAVAGHRTGVLYGSVASSARPPVRQAGGLRWQGARQGRLAGLPVVAHHYRDAAGRRLTLLLAERSFPEAVGARHPPGATIWVAEVDGVAVLCADRPSPSLLVGPDQAQVLLAASLLGLH
jgi:hypothetical protein